MVQKMDITSSTPAFERLKDYYCLSYMQILSLVAVM